MKDKHLSKLPVGVRVEHKHYGVGKIISHKRKGESHLVVIQLAETPTNYLFPFQLEEHRSTYLKNLSRAGANVGSIPAAGTIGEESPALSTGN